MNDFEGIYSQQTVDMAVMVEYSIWGAAVPGTLDVAETVPLVLGTKFSTIIPGVVRGIRWYRDATSAGASHVALWQGTTNVSTTVAVTGQTASGWQRMDFPTPVVISANTFYVTAALYNQNRYQATGGYFASSSITSGPIVCPQGTVSANGLYVYSAVMAAPSAMYNSASYFVDVIFAA